MIVNYKSKIPVISESTVKIRNIKYTDGSCLLQILVNNKNERMKKINIAYNNKSEILPLLDEINALIS